MVNLDNATRERGGEYSRHTTADTGNMYMSDGKAALYGAAAFPVVVGGGSLLISGVENMTDTLPGTTPREEKIAIHDDALRHVRRAQDMENPDDIYLELRKAQLDIKYGNAAHTQESANMTLEELEELETELENDPDVEPMEYRVDNTDYDYLAQIGNGHLGRWSQPDQTQSVSHLEHILDKNAEGNTMDELRKIDSDLKEYDEDISRYREEVQMLQEKQEEALENGNTEEYKEYTEDLVLAEAKMQRAQQTRAESLDSRGKLLQYQEDLLHRLEETTTEVGESRTDGLNVMEPHNWWLHRIAWLSVLGPGEVAGGALGVGLNRVDTSEHQQQ